MKARRDRAHRGPGWDKRPGGPEERFWGKEGRKDKGPDRERERKFREKDGDRDDGPDRDRERRHRDGEGPRPGRRGFGMGPGGPPDGPVPPPRPELGGPEDDMIEESAAPQPPPREEEDVLFLHSPESELGWIEDGPPFGDQPFFGEDLEDLLADFE